MIDFSRQVGARHRRQPRGRARGGAAASRAPGPTSPSPITRGATRGGGGRVRSARSAGAPWWWAATTPTKRWSAAMFAAISGGVRAASTSSSPTPGSGRARTCRSRRCRRRAGPRPCGPTSTGCTSPPAPRCSCMGPAARWCWCRARRASGARRSTPTTRPPRAALIALTKSLAIECAPGHHGQLRGAGLGRHRDVPPAC